MADDSDLTLAYYESISAETKEIERLKKELEDLIEASQTTLNSPAPPPPPIPTTRDNWNQRNFDPESKWVTIKHLELHQMYFIGSWGPLIDYIYHLVKDEFDKLTNPSETTAYRHVIDDWEQKSPKMTCLLACIPRQMTIALLEGNITEPFQQDAEFRAEVIAYSSVDHWPGIYVGEVVNKQYFGEKKHAYPGRCLNWHEWKELVPIMREYTDAWRNGRRTTKLSQDIDNTVPVHGKDFTNKFRYVESDTACTKIEVFINKCQEIYVDPGESVYAVNRNDPLLSIPFRRLPREVGWGLYSGDRASQHTHQASTNYLLGFYDASLRYKFGVHRFEQKQYLACRVGWSWLAQTAEYLVSMMCQSYWDDGGLNPALAGTIRVHGTAQSNVTHECNRPNFKKNANFLVDSGLMRRNIDAHKEHVELVASTIRWMNANPHRRVWHNIQQRKADLRIVQADLLEQLNQMYFESLVRDLEDLLQDAEVLQLEI